jgi:hypothetical protein
MANDVVMRLLLEEIKEGFDRESAVRADIEDEIKFAEQGQAQEIRNDIARSSRQPREPGLTTSRPSPQEILNAQERS